MSRFSGLCIYYYVFVHTFSKIAPVFKNVCVRTIIILLCSLCRTAFGYLKFYICISGKFIANTNTKHNNYALMDRISWEKINRLFSTFQKPEGSTLIYEDHTEKNIATILYAFRNNYYDSLKQKMCTDTHEKRVKRLLLSERFCLV